MFARVQWHVFHYTYIKFGNILKSVYPRKFYKIKSMQRFNDPYDEYILAMESELYIVEVERKKNDFFSIILCKNLLDILAMRLNASMASFKTKVIINISRWWRFLVFLIKRFDFMSDVIELKVVLIRRICTLATPK